MKRQAFLLLCTVSLSQACVLDLEVLDGVGDDVGDSTDTDAESSSTTDAESSSTDAESSSSTDAESSSTDAESSSTDAESSSTDTESSSTDAESSSTDAESSSSTDADWGTSDAPPDCAEAQSQYEEIVAMTGCSADTDCKIISGHCYVGLGGCYYAVNVSVDEAYLDTLAQVWSDGGCTEGVCDCPVSPSSAICDAGTCLGVD